MASDFSALLQEAEKLTYDIEGISDLPKIDRSLHQVLEASSELYSKVAQAGAQDVEANLLLGSKGVDLSQISQTLENISTKRAFEKIAPATDSDVEAHLDNQLKSCVVGVIEQQCKACEVDMEKLTWEHQEAEWDKERLKILNALSAPSGEFLSLGKTSSVFIEPPVITKNALNDQEALYAAKLMEYNRGIIRGNRKSNLVSIFANAAAEFKDSKVTDMWDMLKYMIELPPVSQTEDPIKARYSAAVVKVLINQGLKYLHERYKMYMTSVINENLFDAKRGGIPGTYSLARSFVGLRFQGEYHGLLDGVIEDRPLWPMVYYCLRSGDLPAAIHCLKKSRTEFTNLLALLETKSQNAGNPKIAQLELALQLDYKRSVYNETDPFKRIIFDTLSSPESKDDHSEVAKTADDYLWLKLSFFKFHNEQEDIERYQILQTTILDECDSFNQANLYFQMLILTGQFESGIDFLARSERFRVHSVHIAIAYSELHLLGLSKYPSAPLICVDPVDPKPAHRLNLARLVMIYTNRFELHAIAEAVHYYFALRDICDENKERVFINCIVDLAAETQDYGFLFGKVEPTGIRSKGYLDEFAAMGVTVEDLAITTAKKLITLGQFENAIDLFDIANDQEEVLSLLCSLLSQVVHLQTTEGSLRQRLTPKIAEVQQRYYSLGFKCSVKTLTSFKILGELIVFFDHYHSKQFLLALNKLQELQLLPLSLNEVEERVNNFKRYGGDIAKVIPDLVLATMNILFDQYQKAKANEYVPSSGKTGSHDQQLNFIRNQAKALTNFVGMITYRMPGDTNSRLVQMEILMQ